MNTNFTPSTLAMNSKTATSVAEAASGRESILEAKYDGIRLLIEVTETGVNAFARSGKSKSGKLPAIEAEFYANLPAGTWLDGEAVAFNTDGTQDWGGAQSVLGSGVARAAAGSDKIRFVVFDLLAFGGQDARTVPLRGRRELLASIFDGASFDRVILSPAVEATEEAHQANLEAGYEGSMVKHLDAPYMSGKRSASSLKLKATDTIDCIITGYKAAEAGSWIARDGMIGAIEFKHLAEDGTWIEGRCSGMDTATRRAITDNGAALVGTVIEVSYMTKMPSGTLRHPQYKRLRSDKTAAEVAAG
jgi:ATP-dependent DNA ligase